MTLATSPQLVSQTEKNLEFLRNRRTSFRHTVCIPVTIISLIPERFELSATIIDISIDGAQLEVVDASSVPKHCQLVRSFDDSIYDCEVRWAKGDRLGLRFIDMCTSAQRRAIISALKSSMGLS